MCLCVSVRVSVCVSVWVSERATENVCVIPNPHARSHISHNSHVSFPYPDAHTHTQFTPLSICLQDEARGIIPRAGEEIFSAIEGEKEPQCKYLVRTSFLQIYNERIADLLNPDAFKKQATEKKPSLKIRQVAHGRGEGYL